MSDNTSSSENDSQSSVGRQLAQLSRWAKASEGVVAPFSAIFGLILSIGGLFQFARDEPGIITWSLLSVGVVTLVAACVYILTAKSPGRVFEDSSGKKKERHTYAPWYRRTALVILLVIFAVPIGWLYLNSLPPDKTIVLVADFEGPPEYNVTESIISELRAATKGYDDVEIRSLGDAVSVQEGSSKARELGEEEKASIVLWGWISAPGSTARVTVHAEMLRSPQQLDLRTERDTFRVATAELESFDVQLRLSKEMSYLTLLVTGLVMYNRCDFEGAIDRITEAIKTHGAPESIVNPAVAYFFRGMSHFMKRGASFTPAKNDFGKTIELDSSYTEAFVNRGNIYLSEDSLDLAAEDYRKATELDSSHAPAYTNQGSILLRKGRYEAALDTLNLALQYDSTDYVAYLNRGTLYRLLKKPDEALENLDEALRINPGLFPAYMSKGNVYEDLGQYDDALAEYRKALEIQPDQHFESRAYLAIARVQICTEQYALAIDTATEAIRHDSSLDRAYLVRGNAYSWDGDPEMAEENYNYFIERNPANAMAYHQRGVARADAGKDSLAISDQSRAIELDPMFGIPYFARGKLYGEAGRFEEAIEDHKRFLALNPQSPMAYHNLAMTYAMAGKCKLALQNLHEARTLATDPEVRSFAAKWLEIVRNTCGKPNQLPSPTIKRIVS